MGQAARGGPGRAERFEGGAQIASTAGIRSEVISHEAGTKLGVDVPALPREGVGNGLFESHMKRIFLRSKDIN